MPDNFENMQDNNVNTENNTSQPVEYKIASNETDNQQIKDQSPILENNMNKTVIDEQPTAQPEPQGQSNNAPSASQPQQQTQANNVPPITQPQQQQPQQAYNAPQTPPNMYGYNAPQPQYMPPQPPRQPQYQPPYNPPYAPPTYGYNNQPYANPYGYNPYANGVHNTPPQQGYRYPQQPMQPQYMPPQPPRPQTPPPYQQNFGQAQSNNDNAYQNTKQDESDKESKKKGMNKVLKAFLIAILSVLGLVVIGFAGYGIVSLVDDVSNSFGSKNVSEQPSSIADPFEGNSSQPANPFEDNNGGQQINPFEQPDNENSLPQTQNEPQANPSKFKLGIVVSPVTEEMKAYSSIIPDGLIIIGVEATSSLANKDIQPYDIITEVDGQKITATEQLHELMDTKQEGDKLTLTIARIDQNNNVEYHEIEAELQANENYSEESSTSESSSEESVDNSNRPSL